jgi:flagellar basal-body rod protein FlgB
VADLSDTAILEALRRQMSMAATRQVVIASNIANAETPGYKSRVADFSDTLDKVAGSVQLASTSPGHLAGQPMPDVDGSIGGARTKEAADLVARRDGNTVQLDQELLAMTRAAGDFARAQTALAAKFRILRYAISEGK